MRGRCVSWKVQGQCSLIKTTRRRSEAQRKARERILQKETVRQRGRGRKEDRGGALEVGRDIDKWKRQTGRKAERDGGTEAGREAIME